LLGNKLQFKIVHDTQRAGIADGGEFIFVRPEPLPGFLSRPEKS
jgi:hypothetical protein